MKNLIFQKVNVACLFRLVNSGTYYGLSWNATNLGGDDFVNFVISGIVEIPAYTFLIFTLNRWGRKVILCGCMMVSGLLMIGTLFIPKGELATSTIIISVPKNQMIIFYYTVYKTDLVQLNGFVICSFQTTRGQLLHLPC